MLLVAATISFVSSLFISVLHSSMHRIWSVAPLRGIKHFARQESFDCFISSCLVRLRNSVNLSEDD